MPCIDLIKSSFTVHCLDSDIGAFFILPADLVKRRDSQKSRASSQDF